MRYRGVWCVVGGLISLLFCNGVTNGAVSAPKYTLVPIAERGATFSTFGNWPSINNSGVVAFTTILADGNTYAVYTGNGTSVNPIYVPTGSGFKSVQNGPTINDNGWVALGSYTGSNNIWVTNGQTQEFVYSTICESPSINNARKVAFETYSGALATVGVWDNGTVNWVAGTNRQLLSASEPVLNENNQVTFMGQTNQSTSIYRADTSGNYQRLFSVGNSLRPLFPVTLLGNRPTIDDAGNVVTWTEDTGGLASLVRFPMTGSPSIIADSQGAFLKFYSDYGSRPALNSGGGILFWAQLDDGRRGLFTGPDPVNDRMILSGDSLFGRTVSDVVLGYNGLNDAGQAAFLVLFTDGPAVVVRATPVPEPAIAIGCAVFSLLGSVGRGTFRPRSIRSRAQ